MSGELLRPKLALCLLIITTELLVNVVGALGKMQLPERCGTINWKSVVVCGCQLIWSGEFEPWTLGNIQLNVGLGRWFKKLWCVFSWGDRVKDSPHVVFAHTILHI